MAKLIKSTGEITDISPSNGKVFTLEELQKHIGGYIEIVYGNKEGLILIIDEDGKSKDLQENSYATQLYEGVISEDDYIVGDVVLCANFQVE